MGSTNEIINLNNIKFDILNDLNGLGLTSYQYINPIKQFFQVLCSTYNGIKTLFLLDCNSRGFLCILYNGKPCPSFSFLFEQSVITKYAPLFEIEFILLNKSKYISLAS